MKKNEKIFKNKIYYIILPNSEINIIPATVKKINDKYLCKSISDSPGTIICDAWQIYSDLFELFKMYIFQKYSWEMSIKITKEIKNEMNTNLKKIFSQKKALADMAFLNYMNIFLDENDIFHI